MAWLKNFCLALAGGTLSWGVQAADLNGQWSRLLNSTDPALQTEWGVRYEHGEGVPQDYGRAVHLYCLAARQGHAAAQYQLGWLYANGRGGLRDDALAAAWFRLAAAQGDTPAQRMLALMSDVEKKRPLCRVPDAAKTDLQSSAGFSPQRRRIEEWVYRLAPDYELDPDLVLSVIAVESAFNSQARSPKNAQGLMQLIPATAERFGVSNSMDPVQNLQGGMAYLRWLLAFFRGDVRLALAGYNAGEGAVQRYQGIPPYPETQAYVAKVMRLYGRPIHPPMTGGVRSSSVLIAMDTSRSE